MTHVIILTTSSSSALAASKAEEAELGLTISALQQAIASDKPDYTISHINPPSSIEAMPSASIVCPLTLDIPDGLFFSGQAVYQACRDVEGLRQRVQQQLGYEIGAGQVWLPMVLTAKGALYGEAICLAESSAGQTSSAYHQPLHLPDRLRQPLYRLGQGLVKLLNAPPAVYLVQVAITNDRVCFDRLWPFPAAPAIASIGVQIPNLFTCHWRCLTSQPIHDLVIPGTALYQKQ